MVPVVPGEGGGYDGPEDGPAEGEYEGSAGGPYDGGAGPYEGPDEGLCGGPYDGFGGLFVGSSFGGLYESSESNSFILSLSATSPHSDLPLSFGNVQMSPRSFEKTVPGPQSNLNFVNGPPLPQSTHL